MLRRSASALAAVAFVLPLAAGATTTSDSCSSVAACVLGTNTSTGIGVNGISAKGFGVEGSTSIAATTTSAARAGVIGKDLTNNKSDKYNSGVAGTSTYGYGGSFTSTHGIGLNASSATLGSTSINGTASVRGSDNGLTVYTQDAGTANGNPNTGASALIAYGQTYPFDGGGGDEVFRGYGCYITPDNPDRAGCYESSSIDANGSAVFQGTVTENGSPDFRTRSTTGQDVTSFGARTASPTIEDFGTATMRNGVATVALDKTFASTIAPGYMIFVTPHGDSNSLYTVQSTTTFTVRESKGGRSTLTFDYRIVGRPLDTKAQHLPTMRSRPAAQSMSSRRP
jgi:hypothetical protein